MTKLIVTHQEMIEIELNARRMRAQAIRTGFRAAGAALSRLVHGLAEALRPAARRHA